MRITTRYPPGASALLALLWLSTASASAAAAASASASANSPPNIVFILADDLGWNDVSWHNDQVVSPNMQQLVDTGVQLEQSYVQPLCTPSRSAFLTGLYPFRIGRQGRPLGRLTPTGLTLNQTILPERLSDLGYSTHLVGKWHLGYCNWAYTPTERGFDTFYGFYQGSQFHFNHSATGGYDFRDQKEVDFSANGTYSTHLFGDRAVKIIEEHPRDGKPLFLYLALQNVHVPLEVPAEYLAHYPEDLDEDRRLLLGMVTALDEAVGRVVQALKDAGLYDNTVVVFSSDNGGVESNQPLRGNKGSVWEGGTRAPGFVHSPLLQGTPRVHSGLLHITDWHNTLLALAGAPVLPPNDGFNQWDALKDPAVASPRISFIYNLDNEYEEGTLGAIRLRNHKFVMGEDRDSVVGDETGPWLFNLEDDPNETVNLVEFEPALAMALEVLLLEETPNVVPRDEPPNDPEGDASNWGGVWTPGWCDVP
ncbi:arylsulfatase B-like [Penaeus japonicus]|uniref:arylsulfatase B-like n=1 Tax=Penaeus japonicus TaxID=27405 RepID=UPI001C70BD34|nr:arylsulfatase B-like [Penaeus japonicus]